MEPEVIDPTIALPLRRAGLLDYLVADTAISSDIANRLADAIVPLIQSGVFDRRNGRDERFHSISLSRLGFFGSETAANSILEELHRRGLAKPSSDGRSIPIAPAVRYAVLVLLAQYLRQGGSPSGAALAPATDRSDVVSGLIRLLNLPGTPSTGSVITLDLDVVSTDLQAVPLEEVLSFKESHGASYRAYARSVKRAVRELSALTEDESAGLLRQRQEEIKDLAAHLRKTASQAWRKPASFALGIAGCAWTFAGGDAVAGSLALGAALIGGTGAERFDAGDFSYLFEAQAGLSRT